MPLTLNKHHSLSTKRKSQVSSSHFRGIHVLSFMCPLYRLYRETKKKTTHSEGMSSEFSTMEHKTSKTEQVSLWSECFPLQLDKNLVNDTIQFECRERWMLSSLDTPQSSATKSKTYSEDSLWWRRRYKTSKHFSFDGWRSFLATTQAKFLFGLDSP